MKMGTIPQTEQRTLYVNIPIKAEIRNLENNPLEETVNGQAHCYV
jgi:hypothetical protein